MIIVEVKLEHSDDYNVRCVSIVEFTNEQLVSFLKEENYYSDEQVVGWDTYLAQSEGAVYFYSSGGMGDGVCVRQRRVKLYQATDIGNGVFHVYEKGTSL